MALRSFLKVTRQEADQQHSYESRAASAFNRVCLRNFAKRVLGDVDSDSFMAEIEKMAANVTIQQASCHSMPLLAGAYDVSSFLKRSIDGKIVMNYSSKHEESKAIDNVMSFLNSIDKKKQQGTI